MELSITSERIKRLIVLVPDSLVGNLDLAIKIFWIALKDHREVYYLALVEDEDKILSTTYSIATMKAVTAGKCLIVQSKTARPNRWLETLRDVYQPGDLVVCHQEQSIRKGFLKTVPLSEYLIGALDIPVISISGFYHPEQDFLWKWSRSLIAWLGFLFILLVFSAFEIRLDALVQGFIGKALLFLLVTLEIGAVGVWDSINR